MESIPARRCGGRYVPTRKRDPDGWTCWQALVSAPAWPTTWVSGRQSRCLLVEQARGASPRPSLLVAPASLLANWAAEIEKFAPGLKAAIVHPSMMPADQVKAFTAEQASDYDLAITSYASLLRIPVFAEAEWQFVI